MIGCATNEEIEGSSGGAVEGLKPKAASAAIVVCAPGIPPVAGTAGSLPEGGAAGTEATGLVGAGDGGESALTAGGVALSGADGGDWGGGLLATTVL